MTESIKIYSDTAMSNLKIWNVSILISLIIFGCKKNDNIIQLPDEFSAGQDLLVYDTTQVKLNATDVDSMSLTGNWRIISGDTINSGFSDIHDSKAVFSGIYRDPYILEWSVANGENTLSDSISVRFIASIPEDITAGVLYLVYDTNYVVLNGTPLIDGLLGNWSVISGDSNDIEFSNRSIANSNCTGSHLNSYILRWTVSNGMEEKYADAKFIIGDMFVDPRDNLKYKKVKVGDQIWMAEDLKAGIYTDGESLTLLPDETWLYEGNLYDKSYFMRSDYVDFIGQHYPIDEVGYYYTWAAVMNEAVSSNDIPSGVQGICPDGWHVPSSEEFNQLLNFLAGDYILGKEGLALRTDYAWKNEMDKGTNYYGFSALAKGYHYADFYGETGTSSAFWTTFETDYEEFGQRYYAYFFNISWNYANITSSKKIEGRNVRCLQNDVLK